MKLFLIITSSLLVTALIVTVCVFWYISGGIASSQMAPTATTDAGVETAGVVEGVPLRDLPLGDSQKSALEKVGVDVETFVITPVMQSCAAEKLGAERMDEIIAGSAPSTIETARLLPCIN